MNAITMKEVATKYKRYKEIEYYIKNTPGNFNPFEEKWVLLSEAEQEIQKYKKMSLSSQVLGEASPQEGSVNKCQTEAKR